MIKNGLLISASQFTDKKKTPPQLISPFHPKFEQTCASRKEQGIRLPEIDEKDLIDEQTYGQRKKRQFAPEYSQNSYNTMLAQEHVIIPKDSSYWRIQQRVSSCERSDMIQLICELVKLKGYKDETLFCACDLADRYIYTLSLTKQKPE